MRREIVLLKLSLTIAIGIQGCQQGHTAFDMQPGIQRPAPGAILAPLPELRITQPLLCLFNRATAYAI